MGTYRSPKQDKDTRRKMELSKKWKNQPKSTWFASKCACFVAGVETERWRGGGRCVN